MVGLCGSDLIPLSQDLNPMVSFPRSRPRGLRETILVGRRRLDSRLKVGTDVAVFLTPTVANAPPTPRRGRPNACQFNQTFGIQRDGALTELIVLRQEKLYPANLTTEELCSSSLLLSVFMPSLRGRVAGDRRRSNFGCGGVELRALWRPPVRGARTICSEVGPRPTNRQTRRCKLHHQYAKSFTSTKLCWI